MLIEVFSDVVCPWCYVGEKRLEKALQTRPDLETEVRWRPFQLRPEMPAGGLAWREFALDKFGGEANMKAAFRHVSAAGASDGARFDFERVASAPNTVDAHRLILHAADHAREWATADALFEAYFLEGRDLNNQDHLAQVAARAGLDPEAARRYLSGDAGREEVAESQKLAANLGVSGVPFYIFDGRYAVSGAQPVEVFARALDAAAASEVA